MAKMTKLIINIRSRMPAKIVVRSPRRKLQPSPLNKEEQMPLVYALHPFSLSTAATNQLKPNKGLDTRLNLVC